MKTKKPEEAMPVSCEAIRVLEDRMMATEQDHRRLNSSFEAKVAVDAELADFQENVRNEVYFVLTGLPRIPPDIQGKEWQARAVSDVKKVIVSLLGKELPIVVVQNITGRGPDAPTRYHVWSSLLILRRFVRSSALSSLVATIAGLLTSLAFQSATE